MTKPMVTRTTGIDGLINIAIERCIDAVKNPGANLDTRHYRMPVLVKRRQALTLP